MRGRHRGIRDGRPCLHRPPGLEAMILATLLSSATAAAQIPPPDSSATPMPATLLTTAPEGGYRATAGSTHPRGTVVAMAIRIATGSSTDPRGLEGTASLLAQVLRDEATRAVGPEVAKVLASVDRTTTTFTLLFLP